MARYQDRTSEPQRSRTIDYRPSGLWISRRRRRRTLDPGYHQPTCPSGWTRIIIFVLIASVRNARRDGAAEERFVSPAPKLIISDWTTGRVAEPRCT